MTKKELKWRLSDLPTGGEIADLVQQEVITKEEARDILFNEDKASGQKVKELEEEVKFLRELCDKLAAKTNGGWATIIHEYHRYIPHYPVWYNTYSSAIGGMQNGNVISAYTSGTTKTLSNNPVKGLSSLNS